ncbi:MAG TPA: glycosyltransferase 87 family protein [Gemmatimonadota bacterium]|nr:glycosyltransferase 87 family protein [Gemmatimonadota bacterium]
MTRGGLTRAARAVLPLAIFLLLPLLVAVLRLEGLNDRFTTYGFDFRGTLWEPAGKVLDGANPYPSVTDWGSIASGNPSVYPPLPITMALPFARLGFDVALTIWVLLLVVAVVVALRIVGVRDWRCFALALMCPPVVEGLFFGNVTLLLLVPLALAWRWRSRVVGAGLAVATAIAVKPLLVPLLVWLILTRRLAAAAVSAAACVALIIVPWAALGFDGFGEYPRLLSRLESVYGPGTDSLPAALSWLGSGGTARQVICLTAALALVALAFGLRRRPNGDLCVFTVMIGASIVAAPIVWPHYLALLLIPLGVARPRVDAVWAVPYTLPLVLAIDSRIARASTFVLLALAMTALPLLDRRAPANTRRSW